MIIELSTIEIFSSMVFLVGLLVTYIFYYLLVKRFEKNLGLKPLSSSLLLYSAIMFFAAFILICFAAATAGFLLLGISGLAILLATANFYYSRKKKMV